MRPPRGYRVGVALALWLLALWLLAGCAGSTPEFASPLPYGTPVLLDDFSPPDVAWARFDTEESAVYALEGELFLEDRGKAMAVYTPLEGAVYDDVTIGVRVRHVQGTVNNWMGVLCRQQDEESYYLLAISADGYYLVLRVDGGVATPLSGPAFSEAIHVGKAENVMEARCRENALSLRVNGSQLVARVDDGLAGTGQVALFADAVDRGETTLVAFDDFVLTTQ